MYSNVLIYLVLAGCALSAAAILGVSLVAMLRGRLTQRGKAMARNTLIIAVLVLVIAYFYFGSGSHSHTHFLRTPRWVLRH